MQCTDVDAACCMVFVCPYVWLNSSWSCATSYWTNRGFYLDLHGAKESYIRRGVSMWSCPWSKIINWMQISCRAQSVTDGVLMLTQSFERKAAFIATQLPLEQTVADFWNMCIDYRCQLIVCLVSHSHCHVRTLSLSLSLCMSASSVQSDTHEIHVLWMWLFSCRVHDLEQSSWWRSICHNSTSISSKTERTVIISTVIHGHYSMYVLCQT